VDSSLPPDDAGPELEIVKQILNYFLRNSKAADTLEGIARWRLLEEQVHRSFQQTESALAWLVKQGFLEEVETVGSSRIFRLAPQGHEKTARFLAGEKSAPKDKKKPEQ
jgi:Fe2+ or Zn2+ uptake regulation protein